MIPVKRSPEDGWGRLHQSAGLGGFTGSSQRRRPPLQQRAEYPCETHDLTLFEQYSYTVVIGFSGPEKFDPDRRSQSISKATIDCSGLVRGEAL